MNREWKVSFFTFLLFKMIVDLQCYANFCYTAKWLSFLCMYISFFVIFHPGCPCAGQLDLMACLFSMSSFASTNPKLPVQPTPSPLPLGHHTSVLYVCESYCFYLFCFECFSSPVLPVWGRPATSLNSGTQSDGVVPRLCRWSWTVPRARTVFLSRDGLKLPSLQKSVSYKPVHHICPSTKRHATHFMVSEELRPIGSCNGCWS